MDTSQELGQFVLPILVRLLGAAVTLVIGRALVATVNFLLFKPFEVGDVVGTSGMLGVVIPRPQQEVHLVNVQE